MSTLQEASNTLQEHHQKLLNSIEDKRRWRMSGFRYVILLVATLSSTFIYSNRITFGFTVICQEPQNATEHSDYYLSAPSGKMWMFTATAIGMCIGPIPLYLTPKVGLRATIAAYGAIATISAALYPLADSFGFWPSFLCRLFSGFCQASQLHFSNAVVLAWAAKAEAGFFFSIMLAASQLGPLFTMILDGEMCSSSLGWEASYYILAALIALSTIAFAYFCTEQPEQSPYVSYKELQLISKDKVPVNHDYKASPVKVLTDVTVVISLVMFAGYYVGMIVFQQYSPSFIKQVLHYSIRQTGYFSAIPMIFAIIIKVALGKIIDMGLGLPPKWRLALPLLILELMSATAIFLTGFVDDRMLALTFDMIFASLHFFVPVICSRTIQVRGGYQAHIAMNANMIVAGSVQVFLPSGVMLLVPDNTREEWSRLFYMVTALILITTGLFVWLIDARLAPWATAPEAEKQNSEGEKDQEEGFESKFKAFGRITLNEKPGLKELPDAEERKYY